MIINILRRSNCYYYYYFVDLCDVFCMLMLTPHNIYTHLIRFFYSLIPTRWLRGSNSIVYNDSFNLQTLNFLNSAKRGTMKNAAPHTCEVNRFQYSRYCIIATYSLGYVLFFNRMRIYHWFIFVLLFFLKIWFNPSIKCVAANANK